MSDTRVPEQLSLPLDAANSTTGDDEAAVGCISCTGEQVCKTHTTTSWEEVRVEDFGEIVSGRTPSRANPAYWNGSIPWVTPSEITKLKNKYLYDTRERITKEGLAGSAAKLLPVSSVVVTSRATLGEAAIAGVPLTTNQGFKSIILNSETDPVFAYYLLRTLKPEMVRLASGTTFLEISKSDFANIRVRRPDRAEQSRIAAVLDTVDEAIAKTEAVIGKLRQVRAGLLHDLLTRDLDEHGQLRDPIAHPEQFQDSPFGHIPREWGMRTCQSLCRDIVVGIVVKQYRGSVRCAHVCSAAGFSSCAWRTLLGSEPGSERSSQPGRLLLMASGHTEVIGCKIRNLSQVTHCLKFGQ